MVDKLLVIISDRISELLDKGEVVPRYYNPGDLFGEVHILMTNDDRPDPGRAQELVGRARLFMHNLPFGGGDFALSLGMRPGLMTRWALPGMALAEEIGPRLIRCHGASVNGFLALSVKERLGIPCVVSLHSHSGDVRGGLTLSLKERLIFFAQGRIERLALSGADVVVCVYEYLSGWAEELGAKRVEVIHNVINGEHLILKESYGLGSPPRLISVGRLMPGKDPSPMIEGLAQVEDATLTLVGSGPLSEKASALAKSLGIAERVIFIPSLPNREVVGMLKDYDIFVYPSLYGEVSKGVLEAMCAGLPIIHARHPFYRPEFLSDAALFVENTGEGYGDAFAKLLADHGLREEMGQRSRLAGENVAPEKMEARLVALYRELIS